MSDLRELYQEVIIDHNKNPRHFFEMKNPDRQAEGFNPLCGDRVQLFLKMNQDMIESVSFQGCGCAISTASASLMTDAIQGKSLKDAMQLFEQFHKFMLDEATECHLEKLSVLSGVREFPTRIKCAMLAWHTLMAAIRNP